MPPAFSLFSTAASAAIDERDHVCGANGGTTLAHEVKPKGRRGAKLPAPKKPPQRGLGVEKLERLRLQERWKMMTETLESPVPLPIYDLPALSRFSWAWMESSFVPLQGTFQNLTQSVPPPSPAMMHLPRCRTGITLPSIQSTVQDQLDRFGLGNVIPFPEPPSNQTPTPCFSDQCEFRVSKKRLLGRYPGQESGSGFHVLDLAFNSMTSNEAKISGENQPRSGKAPRDAMLAEYNFFPAQKRAASAAELQGSEFSGASSGASGYSPGFLDLTLRLSS